MTVRVLQTGDEVALEAFLSSYTATCMYIRSNLQEAGLTYNGKPYEGEYWGSFDEAGTLNGVLAHYWNNNIMMQANNPEVLSDLLQAFKAAVSRPIAGVLGVNDQADQVIAELGVSDAPFALNTNELLYSLDLTELTLPTNLHGNAYRMVGIDAIDRTLLTRWIRAYEIEALKSEDDDALTLHVADRVDRTLKSGDSWALLVDGKPVCLSGFCATLPDVVQVGPVWTPPEHRCKGYARTLLALTLLEAREKGVERAILFTDAPAAAKAYEAVGFQHIGFYRLALLKQPVTLQIEN
ncbi:MAG: GNAT family N-acetyltransferase [Alphaproteobacteria bacterium]|nr:GNAT family N-acetyltransferase [Alphaproteobacteria bacterium]